MNASRRFQEWGGKYFSMTASFLVKISKDIDRLIDKTTGKLKKVAKTNYPDHPRAHWTFTPESDEYGVPGVQGGIDQALDSMRKLKQLLIRS